MAPPVSSATLAKTQPSKLHKEPSRDSQEEEANGKDNKKKSSVFSGLFSRKNEKTKDRGRNASIGSMESEYTGRGSEESSRSGGHRPNGSGNGSPGDGTISPTTAAAIQQQKQQEQQALSNARAEPAAQN